MNYTIFFITAAALSSFSIPVVHAQAVFSGYAPLFTEPRRYTAYRATGPMHIDGKLKEASWNAAEWSDYFMDIKGSQESAPPLKTRFKLVWDTQYVYIAAELEEPNICATLKEHDSSVFEDNDFEIFIDPDGDTHNYFEIEVNALNTIFDLFLTKPYRNEGTALVSWDVQQLKSAVSLKGTINRAKNRDKKWFVEMGIPLSSIRLDFRERPPADGDFWRINFLRVEHNTKKINAASIKKTDSIPYSPFPDHYWAWSPQGVVNMHMPERWGYLQFSTQPAGSANIDFPLPPAETCKKYLWLLFYKQQEYRQQHNQYATELSQLNFPGVIESAGLNCRIVLRATGLQYIAILQSTPGNERWQIDQEGKIIKATDQ